MWKNRMTLLGIWFGKKLYFVTVVQDQNKGRTIDKTNSSSNLKNDNASKDLFQISGTSKKSFELSRDLDKIWDQNFIVHVLCTIVNFEWLAKTEIKSQARIHCYVNKDPVLCLFTNSVMWRNCLLLFLTKWLIANKINLFNVLIKNTIN